MSRPKESVFGLISGTANLYNTNKIRKLGSEFNSVTNSINNSIAQASIQTLTAIGNLEELQIASMAGIYQIGIELNDLSKASWEIVNALDREDKRQETLGTLKLFLIHVEEEIDKIKSMSIEFPVYSAYMAEELREMFRSKNVSIEHFKRMPSTTDIKWAKSVIDSVESLFDELYNNLG